MGWHDEISGLDADVAAGRISAEEYRSRRDERLSRPDSGAHSGTENPASLDQADTGAADANPFPPPFRWGGAHRADAAQTEYLPIVTDEGPPNMTDAAPASTGTHPSRDAERTQLVRPTSTPTTGPDADSTQLVRPRPSGAVPDADSTQLVRPGTGAAVTDADRTQLVRAGGSAPGPSTRAATQPSRPDGTSPPWHRGDGFTPRPGSDPFEQFRTRGKRSWVKPTAVAVTAVVVVALVVVLVLVRNGSSTVAATTIEPSATTAAPASTTQAPVIASLPGKQLLDKTFDTFAELRGAEVLSPEELAALEPGRPLGLHLRVHQDGPTTTTVWTCTVDGDPSTVVARLTSRSAGAGFVPVRPPYPDVAALQQLPAAGKPGPGALRASYSNGDTVVHVESRGPGPAAAGATFRSALEAELASLPPG